MRIIALELVDGAIETRLIMFGDSRTESLHPTPEEIQSEIQEMLEIE
jgi:hypothetical protein